MGISADGTWTADSDITADNPPTGKFLAAQYGQAARNLLPRGRAWNRKEGGNQAAFCDALGIVYAQQDADAVEMLSEFFPATATEGIDEWNASLGLPDACSGAPASQAANQQQIVARLIASGGQDLPYYQALATALGYEISISEFNAAHQGTDAPPGLITKADDWAHTWRINILNPATAPSSTLLECLLNRYKPAHTQFYIVNGVSPPPSARLFNVDDDVTKALLIPPP